MTQCEGKTQRGERCKREAREGSAYCSIHQEQEARARRPEDATESPSATKARDPDWTLKAALGFAALAAIVLYRIRR